MAADTARGMRLRAARETARLTQRALAARLLDAIPDRQKPDVEAMVTNVKRWERGGGISDRHKAAYALALGRDVGELFPGAPVSVLAPLTDQLDVLRGHIGHGDVAALRARAHALRLADDVVPGPDLIDLAYRHLDAAERTYWEASATGDVRAELLSVVAELAQIAGWIASDTGDTGRAERTYRRGVTAAREAADPTVESNLVGSLAYLLSNAGDPRALDLARDAVDALSGDSPPRARALAWDRLAWVAAASSKQAQVSMRALGEAGSAMADYDGTPDPQYLYWVSPEELQIMEARAYTELRRPLRAVPILADVLARYDVTHARELALYLSWLAVALADANEPEESAKAARQMLTISGSLSSERTSARSRIVLDRLRSYAEVPEVAELLAEALA